MEYGSFDGLNVGDCGRFGFGFGLGFGTGLGTGGPLPVFKDAFEQEGDGAFAWSGFAYFSAWSEDA
jgi:hypothetical protein